MSGHGVVLALDLGTTMAKAALFDGAGRRLFLARERLSVRRLDGGDGVEQSPEELLRAVRRLLDGVAAELPASTRLSGAGIASQRGAILLWNRTGGRPRSPVVSWMDRRGAGLVARLASKGGAIARRSGLRLTAHYGAVHLARLFRADRALARDAAAGRVAAGPVASFLLARLGGLRDAACDPTLAQRTLLYDPRRGRWDPWLCGLFGVPVACLPEVRPSCGSWGELRVGNRRVPVVGLAGDQQAAAAAFDLDARRSLLVHYGTGAFALWPAPAASARAAGLLRSARADRAGSFYFEGTVNAAGAALDAVAGWIGRDAVDRAIARLNRAAARARPGQESGRALLVPAFAGLGAPHWRPGARAVLAGADAIAGPDDLVRATLDGIAHRVADIVEAAGGRGAGRKGIVASGPLARWRVLLAAQADATGLPVARSGEEEATLRGAARLALRAAGGGRMPPARAGRAVQPALARAGRDRIRARWRRAVAAAGEP